MARPSLHAGLSILLVATSLFLGAVSIAGESARGEATAERWIVGVETVPLTSSAGSDYHGARVVRADLSARFLVVLTEDPQAFLADVKADANVRYVHPDTYQHLLLDGPSPAMVPNDPQWINQYGPQQVNADLAWDLWTGSTAANVCVIDTGVRYTHEDLAGARWFGGYDFVNDDADPMDDHYHGTHVSGIAAGTLNNLLGIAGMGQVGLYGVKVLDAGGSGWWSDVASGITWCADNAGPRSVLSMSLGGGSFDQAVQDAVNYAWSAGDLVIAAAGNSGCADCIGYPAAMQNVMAITCTQSGEGICWFSSTGPQAALAAPGMDILSSMAASDSSYDYLSGTSMSTPHVSGAAALYWSLDLGLTNAGLRDRLLGTAQDLDVPGHDWNYGCGELDVLNLFNGVILPCEVPPPPPPPPAPANDNFSAAFGIAIPSNGNGTNLGATMEAGEPAPCGALGSTVWYVFTAPSDATVTVDTFGSGYDTTLAAYQGPSVDNLVNLACNDDYSNLQSLISFGVTAGQTYYVQVGGFAASQGNFFLNAYEGGGGGAPFISFFDPSSGPAGTYVHVYGSGFATANGVYFGGNGVGWDLYDDGHLAFVVPNFGPGPYSIEVYNPNGGAYTCCFELTDNGSIPPSISFFDPSSGPEGTVVGVYGEGFSTAYAFYFGGMAIGFSVYSDGYLEFEVPGAGPGPYELGVENPYGGSFVCCFELTDGGGGEDVDLAVDIVSVEKQGAQTDLGEINAVKMGRVKITVSTCNVGAGPFDGGYVQVYATATAPITEQATFAFIGSDEVGALAPGACENRTFTWDHAPTVGDVTLHAWGDSYYGNDTNYGNNEDAEETFLLVGGFGGFVGP